MSLLKRNSGLNNEIFDYYRFNYQQKYALLGILHMDLVLVSSNPLPQCNSLHFKFGGFLVLDIQTLPFSPAEELLLTLS